MDPISAAASVVGLFDSVTRLSRAISQFKDDYKFADADLDMTRQHVLLLKEEIRALESKELSHQLPCQISPNSQGDFDHTTLTGNLDPEDLSFTKAISTSRELLSTIEATFPLRDEPHTWKSKVRWALKDKQVLQRVKQQLQYAESTLQGIAAMEQIRISREIYRTLRQQQTTLNSLQSSVGSTQSTANLETLNQNSLQLFPSMIQTQSSDLKPYLNQPTMVISRPSKSMPWTARLDLWGLSAQVIAIPKEKGGLYQADLQIFLFGKLYALRLDIISPFSSLGCKLHVRNIVRDDSVMAVACKMGDFDAARQLLITGAAHGSDTTPRGWPVLDYAIESGSTRLVRLLLEHGAHPDMAYGEHNMTALQSSFLRGNIDIARLLITRGANIEYIDSDGYSVLSYLWIVDKSSEISLDFMRLCLTNEFAEINACDSRGWLAFHRAAAVGTAEDVEAFLRLGASLSLRAEWYGWTALFFAASHDNVETFMVIVRHSAADVYESLDGDGWTLLHCCIYFGAARVMKLVLQNGVNVNQLSHPAPLPEDPELSYRELTPSDIAIYIGPNRYQMFLETLIETGRDLDLQGTHDIFWDANPDIRSGDTAAARNPHPIYGAEDVDDDKWTLLHWASYNGSSKVKKIFMLKGADPEHMDAITLEENPTLLTSSPLDGR